MRTIIGNIKNFTNNYENIKISFVLIDKYGNKTSYMHDGENIINEVELETDENGDFTTSLFETQKSKIKLFYKLFIEDKATNKILSIPEGDTDLDITDINKINKTLDQFYEYIEKDGTYKFNCDISILFEKYFAGENEFFTQDETNLINIYLDFLDGGNEREDMKALSEYLDAL